MKSTNCRIITFYSYKGGTGRSMALANVAWVLAANRKRVLVIDWDLEAPGLHRYFRPFLVDEHLTSSEGLIDFVMSFADEVIRPQPQVVAENWFIEHADITPYAISINFDDFPSPGRIDFVPAGRQGTSYAKRVSVFDWQNFYDRLGGGAFLEALKRRMRKDYDYILIDSRTGVSDTAGICTVQMPDVLAVCFTYNNQSIEGAAAVAHSARVARRQLRDQADLRSIEVLPIPTRVDQSETDMLRARELYARSHFEDLIQGKANLDVYWRAVEIPYIPFYSYEEMLAPFRDEPNDPKSLLGAIVRITDQLTGSEVSEFNFPISPEEKTRIREAFSAAKISVAKQTTRSSVTESTIQEKVRQAEAAFVQFSSSQQDDAKRILTRLVRVGRPEDGGIVKQQVREVDLGELSEAVSALASVHLILLERDSLSADQTVEIVDEVLIQHWPRLRSWIEEDFDFLTWRQRLRDHLREWQASDFKNDFLMRGERLREAQNWLSKHDKDLTEREKEFINRSSQTEYKPSAYQDTVGLRACIVRPFGVKDGIDFDSIERNLIDPALERLGIEGKTTLNILEGGNIRPDMLQLLLTASIVIADLSTHDATVFYELGLRHALRDRGTFMISCNPNRLAFDLQIERFFTYSSKNPSASVEDLIRALWLQVKAEQINSPVFMALPDLSEPNPSQLISVPSGFREEVERARKMLGDLKLLAWEARGFFWEVKGLRMIARAEFNLRSFAAAKNTWEDIRRIAPGDLEANLSLGTIYGRLGEFLDSELALNSALSNKEISNKKKAQAYALLGRNAKTLWRKEWEAVSDPLARPTAALRSGLLQESVDNYERAFEEDFNHYNSGLNALMMLKITIELATAYPSVWTGRFKTRRKAEDELEDLVEHASRLAGAVEVALDANTRRLERENTKDIWVEIAVADLRLLTSDNPDWVVTAYRDALDGESDRAWESVRDQFAMFHGLDILKANVEEVIKYIGLPEAKLNQDSPKRVLIFTGHAIDRPHRRTPRFPADKESVVRQKIKEAVEAEMKLGEGISFGIAGGASGGDILFHEVCEELQIPTQLYLAIPSSLYVNQSVRPAGENWVQRFDALYVGRSKEKRVRVLSQKEHEPTDQKEFLPRWLRYKPNYNIWQRNNRWILYNALAVSGDDRVTLIALWDGVVRGDFDGGVGDMVQTVQRQGARTIIIKTESFFDSIS